MEENNYPCIKLHLCIIIRSFFLKYYIPSRTRIRKIDLTDYEAIKIMTTKIKEYYAKDEDELLDLIASEEPDNEGEWVIPKCEKIRTRKYGKQKKITRR